MDKKRKRVIGELHKPARRKVVVWGIDETWQADLVDMQAYSKMNKGYTFLLTVIDNVSKFAWAISLKPKQGLLWKKL